MTYKNHFPYNIAIRQARNSNRNANLWRTHSRSDYLLLLRGEVVSADPKQKHYQNKRQGIMSSSIVAPCPFCHLTVPSADLERYFFLSLSRTRAHTYLNGLRTPTIIILIFLVVQWRIFYFLRYNRRHANSHFECEDEYEQQHELARDRDLAQQIYLAPYSPSSSSSSSPHRFVSLSSATILLMLCFVPP